MDNNNIENCIFNSSEISLNKTKTDSAIICKKLCETTILCSHFIWDNSMENNCILKSGTVDSTYAIKSTSGINCGIVFHKTFSFPTYKKLENTRLNGNLIKAKQTKSLEECIDLCQNNIKLCKSVSYDKSSQECFSYDHQNPPTINSDSETSITNIQGFKKSRVNYLNYIFNSNRKKAKFC